VDSMVKGADWRCTLASIVPSCTAYVHGVWEAHRMHRACRLHHPAGVILPLLAQHLDDIPPPAPHPPWCCFVPPPFSLCSCVTIP
jgi:hypothetical protein